MGTSPLSTMLRAGWSVSEVTGVLESQAKEDQQWEI